LPRVIHYYKAHNYTFVDVLGNTGAPTISRLRAPLGARSGGEKVTIHGRNFRHVTTVLFGRERAPFRVLSPRRVVATAPRHPPGRFHVRVVSSDHGRSAASRASVFRYVGPPRIDGITPSSGPTTGGQKIRVDGSNFFDVKRVRIGRMLVAPNRVVGSSRIWLTTPAHRNPATLDVRVTTRFGASPVQAADQYTYEAPAPAGRS
jgi:hypothetical protein